MNVRDPLRVIATLLTLLPATCAYVPARQPQVPEQAPEGTRPLTPQAAALAKQIEADLRAGRFRQAEAKADELLRFSENDAVAWMYLGFASISLRKNDQAIRAFMKAAALSPRDPRPYLNLALLYAEKYDVDKAIGYYAQALALDDRNAGANYNYGRLLMSQGRYLEAVKPLRRATELNSKDAEAFASLMEATLLSGHRNEATEQVERVLRSATSDSSFLVPLGAALSRVNELDLARKVLERAIAASPNSSAAHLELSKVQVAQNNFESALVEARRAVALAPDSLETNLSFAEALIIGRDYARALDFLLNVRARFEKSAEFQYTLGIAHFGLQHYAAAVEALEKSVEFEPGYHQAHFLLGTVYWESRNLDKAEAHYTAAVTLNDQNPLYHNYLARIFERKGAQFHEAAVEHTEKALALDPQDVESKIRLAKWSQRDGDLIRARRLLEQAISEDPQAMRARIFLARVYSQLGFVRQAEEQRDIIRTYERERAGRLVDNLEKAQDRTRQLLTEEAEPGAPAGGVPRSGFDLVPERAGRHGRGLVIVPESSETADEVPAGGKGGQQKPE